MTLTSSYEDLPTQDQCWFALLSSNSLHPYVDNPQPKLPHASSFQKMKKGKGHSGREYQESGISNTALKLDYHFMS